MKKSRLVIYSFDIFTETEHSNLQNLLSNIASNLVNSLNYQQLGKFSEPATTTTISYLTV